MTDSNFDKLEKWVAFSKEHGHYVGELAVAWLLAHPWVGSVIAGAMNKTELAENVKAANWKLTADDLAMVEKTI
jgi:aryl-alcohol dehydrogenase-like predicted oxidoreductase